VKLAKKFFGYGKYIGRAWNSSEKAVIGLVVLIIPFAMAYEALSRYAFSTTPMGLEEFILVLAAYGYFIGAAHASRNRVHITVTILDVIKIPETLRKYLAVFSSFVCFATPLVFFWYAVDYNIFLADRGVQLVPFTWPYWVWTVAMPIGLIILSIYELRNTIRNIMLIRRPKDSDTSPTATTG
jgi:TRAP-type C4-dicarboxylate transport system permease small subunit